MALIKVAAFVLASLLFLVTARVSPDVEEHFMETSVVAHPPAAGGGGGGGGGGAGAPAPVPAPIKLANATGCGGACKGRCALHSRPNVCNRACMTCCSACLCVPPGTYGYRDLCGTCYTKWLTHRNQTKCP